MKNERLASPFIALTFALCWTQGTFRCAPASDSPAFRETLVNQFKKRILTRLGYSTKPNITTFPSDQVRREMTRQFMRHHGLNEIDSTRDVSTRVFHARHFGPNRVTIPDRTPFHASTFQIDLNQHTHQLERAWLKFCTNISHNLGYNRFESQRGRLQLYIIQNEIGPAKPNRHLVLSRPIKSLSSACTNLEVTESLRENYTGKVTFVAVFISGARNRKQLDRKSVMSNIKSTLFMNLVQNGKEAPREKRATGRNDCTLKDGETRCCRYHTYISFKEIHWDDWVIAPKGYDAYYCAGDCPHRYKIAHTFAGIKSLLHLINASRIPAPTCTATRLRPLTLLHLDDTGMMTYQDHPDMIVEDCKCS